ncbi:unnamed protein product [Parnassius apollo]|uniref:(apollo) hypothetical protein n=1 Tax=Parnassius apollo TaxID=110799 RepID=A0A8S3W7D8_PARAO|nr:unnamed protein product [Parnassius apollo]
MTCSRWTFTLWIAAVDTTSKLRVVTRVLREWYQSDLDISDEETESAVNVPRPLDDEGDIPSEIPPGNHNSDNDSNQNMTSTGLEHRNQEILPPSRKLMPP